MFFNEAFCVKLIGCKILEMYFLLKIGLSVVEKNRKCFSVLLFDFGIKIVIINLGELP